MATERLFCGGLACLAVMLAIGPLAVAIISATFQHLKRPAGAAAPAEA